MNLGKYCLVKHIKYFKAVKKCPFYHQLHVTNIFVRYVDIKQVRKHISSCTARPLMGAENFNAKSAIIKLLGKVALQVINNLFILARNFYVKSVIIRQPGKVTL